MIDSLVKFVIDKAFTYTRGLITKRLSSGDAFDQTLRNFIETDLFKLNRQVDALTKQDLFDSVDLFFEGMRSISRFGTTDVDGPPNKKRRTDVTDFVDAKLLKDTANFSDDTQERFKDARKKAGSALANKAMDTKEVIAATCIKVLSQLLETKDLTTALKFCIQYLERLHSREDVKSNFKNEIKYAERTTRWSFGSIATRDIIWYVYRLNRFVFDMALETGAAVESNMLFVWPCITIERNNGREVQEIDPLRDPHLPKIFEMEKRPFCSAIWSFGHEGAEEIKLRRPRGIAGIATEAEDFYLVADGANIKKFNNHGKHVKSFLLSVDAKTQYDAVDVDADQDGNVYALVSRTDGEKDEVHIFNKDGEAKPDGKIQLAEGKYKEGKLAVNQNEVLVLKRKMLSQNAKIELYDANEKGKNQFVRYFGESVLKDPQDIALDTLNGHIFVLDKTDKCLVHRFTIDTSIDTISDRYRNTETSLKSFKVELKDPFAIGFHRASGHIVIASKNSLVYLYTRDGSIRRSLNLNCTDIVSNASMTVTREGRIAVALTEDIKAEHTGKVIVY